MDNFDRVLEAVAREVRKGIIMYLEAHKELLDDPDYKCVYKIVRNAFVTDYFKGFDVYSIGELYKAKVSKLLNETPAQEIEDSIKDVNYLVNLVKKYNIEYDDLFEEYFNE